MPSTGRLRWLPSLLSREQWATVLILAGAALLVAPPDRTGPALVLWLLAVLVGAFVVVLVATRIWGRIRR